ncbi:hypothetical protein Tco_0491513 [Tanacetum coccineum]
MPGSSRGKCRRYRQDVGRENAICLAWCILSKPSRPSSGGCALLRGWLRIRCWKVRRAHNGTRAGSNEIVSRLMWLARVTPSAQECQKVDSGLKRKRASGDDGAGPSKRVRHLSISVEATSDSSAPVTHAAQSPPQTGPKAFEGMPVDQLMGEFDMVTAQQAALVAQLRARFAEMSAAAGSGLCSRMRRDPADKDTVVGSMRRLRQIRVCERFLCTALPRKKMELLVMVEQVLAADAAEYKASCHWAVKYLEGGKNNHFAGLDDFRQKVEGLLEKQEEKLRKLSIEYDEELYPHMLSTIAERRWSLAMAFALCLPMIIRNRSEGQAVLGMWLKCAFGSWLTLARHDILRALRQADYFIKAGVSQTTECAHLPRSDGVPVSVATVSPKDSGPLGMLEVGWGCGSTSWQEFQSSRCDREGAACSIPHSVDMAMSDGVIGVAPVLGLRTSIEDTISKFKSMRGTAYAPGILLLMRERALAYEFGDGGHPRGILFFYHRRYLHLRD